MRHRVAAVEVRGPRVLYAVAVIALLVMPVQYRGGAALPHAHALFQLWTHGGHGLVHHGLHAGGQALSLSASSRASGDTSAVVASADLGGPVLTAMTHLHEKAAGIAVVVLAALLLVLHRSTLGNQAYIRLVGLTCRPSYPPPR